MQQNLFPLPEDETSKKLNYLTAELNQLKAFVYRVVTELIEENSVVHQKVV